MPWLRAAAALALATLAGCAQLPVVQLDQAQALAENQRPHVWACPTDACPAPSALTEEAQALAETAGATPRHRVTLLERGDDALVARLHLIRAARHSIELQSYIFVEDDVGWLMLNELLNAARRGVKVRLLLDQLFSFDDVQLLAAMAGAHENFQTRLYNPTFGKATTKPLEFAAGIVCCFRRFNQRMHNKLLSVDGVAAITGGRNVQGRYFDWEPDFNYRDRDLLILGPAADAMGESFEAFWNHPLSVPIARLHDVAQVLLDTGGRPARRPRPQLDRVERVVAVSAMADNPALLQRRLMAPSFEVAGVSFLADGPDKHAESGADSPEGLDTRLRDLVRDARHSVVLQTPYLVISKPARRVFRELRRRQPAPEVLVSTNSLAATDAWPVYAISHKYKRTYLRQLGMDIREYKPYPERLPLSPWLADDPLSSSGDGGFAPVVSEWQGARPEMIGSDGIGSASRFARDRPVPLEATGRRTGLHAKSMVIDQRIAVVGSHNFDPRSDDLNTEIAVIVEDPEFAAALEAVIRTDAAPDNAWVVARRPAIPVLSGLNYQIGKLFEKLPLFDLWPFRYHTSYQRSPDCPEAQPDENIARSPCWEAVGAFPDVDVRFKSLYTRLMTAFGSGLEPIL